MKSVVDVIKLNKIVFIVNKKQYKLLKIAFNMEHKKIIEEIEKLWKKSVPKNTPVNDVFEGHLIPVKDYSIKLAKIYHADVKVVEIAALLHDIAYIETNESENHEIVGSEMVEKILKGKLSEEKIELIKKCVKHHRGAKDYKRESIEEQIIACADAMSHIVNSIGFMYRAGVEGRDFKESKEWMRGKMERGWKKITLPEARKMVKKEYDAINILLKEK